MQAGHGIDYAAFVNGLSAAKAQTGNMRSATALYTAPL
jgi:hypothetical protein